MSHRKIDKKDFEGKTIAELDCRAVNLVRFKFTDGTTIAIEVESNFVLAACDECAT